MAKKIISNKLLICNGFENYYQDDKEYGFDNIESGFMRMLELSKLSNSKCKLISEIQYDNDEYKQKIIATYNPNNIFKQQS